MDPNNPCLKILVAGEPGCGKTALLSKYLEDSMDADQQVKHVVVDNMDVTLQLFDTWQKDVQLQDLDQFDGIMLAYDRTDYQAFRRTMDLFKQMHGNYSKMLSFVFVENKSDLVDPTGALREMGKNFIEPFDISFFFVSAATGMNVEEAFTRLAFKTKQRVVGVNMENIDKIIPQPWKYVPNYCGRFNIPHHVNVMSNGFSDEEVELIMDSGPWDTFEQVYVENEVDIELKRQPSETYSEDHMIIVIPKKIIIIGTDPAGCFYAIQTIWQIVQTYGRKVQCCDIWDKPRYRYRGLMIDLARNNMNWNFLKWLVTFIPRYKMNRLHIRMSDDQGYRFFSNNLPKLNDIASEICVDGGPSECRGRPSVLETRNLRVEGKKYFVEIIYEVSLPSHAGALMASIPSLNPGNKCAKREYRAADVLESIGKTYEISFEKNPNASRIIYTIFAEMRDVFGSIIHIGGHDVKRLTDHEYRNVMNHVRNTIETNWQKEVMVYSEATRIADFKLVQVCKHEGLNQQTNKYRLAPYLIKAVKNKGSKLVLSLQEHLGLDRDAKIPEPIGLGKFSEPLKIEDMYDVDLVDRIEGIDDSMVEGLEGCLWGSYVKSKSSAFAYIFPRLFALAENCWCQPETKNLDRFMNQVPTHHLFSNLHIISNRG